MTTKQMTMKTVKKLIDIKWSPSLVGLTGLALGLCVLFTFLGQWQLGRAQEKREAIDQANQLVPAVHVTPKTVDKKNFEKYLYKPVELSGQILNARNMFLDNQLYQGKAGVHVITPVLVNDHVILVNRGWIPKEKTRGAQIGYIPESTPLVGRFKKNHVNPFGKETAQCPPPQWPFVVQKLDPEFLSSCLGYPLAPLVLMLDPKDPYCYHQGLFKVTTMSPEKHLGYAFQWFALALTLFILSVWVLFKKGVK